MKPKKGGLHLFISSLPAVHSDADSAQDTAQAFMGLAFHWERKRKGKYIGAMKPDSDSI